MLEELPNAIERARTSLGDSAFNNAVRRGSVMEYRDLMEFVRTEIERPRAVLR
jgi:hypothetical protein